ncbi:MAG TPA: AAA family ATPase, partial [Acidimicrobiales bacterium]|nr:AAA family ATPase [Acidimicrobiales bacterium]
MASPMTARAAVAETHSAIVFFVGDRAYKLKKPVDLGFLDFRTPAARATACAREVELNRRIAPDVYLGVADVVGPDGVACDHLVVMRRMPDDRRLATLVAEGADVRDDLRRLARLVAGFHAAAARSPDADRAAGRDALAARWAANTAGLADVGRRVVEIDDVVEVDALAARYLSGREPLFARRIAEGRALDGHGDLLADDIFLLPDGPRVLDCLEFDDDLRRGDALADVAFLAMDLERLGRPDLGDRFLAAYRRFADDAWPASLGHHHVAYRAQVRAKVRAIRARQGDGAAAVEARDLLALARRHLETGAVRLVLVGGLPGTGKSTLATGLGEALGATVLRSDELRKELAGLPADRPAPAPFGEGLYRPEQTGATYAEMLARAGTALALGESVVLDASWVDERRRAEARALAADRCADTIEVRCAVASELAAERIRRRTARGGDASDATPEIAVALAAAEDPWPGAVALDTGAGPADALAKALAAIGP